MKEEGSESCDSNNGNSQCGGEGATGGEKDGDHGDVKKEEEGDKVPAENNLKVYWHNN